jgi:hypothetical protein
MTGSTRRLLSVGALVAALLTALLGAPALLSPAHADSTGTTPQTLHFTSDPPTDAIVGYRYNYVVTAESSSGLPVVLSADPATPACTVSPEPPFIYGNVIADHAGPCTVFADQPGDATYAPAPRISMTFQIGKESTTLAPKTANKGLLGLTPTTFKAGLTYTGWFGPGHGAQFPYVGQEVTFSVGGKPVCTATTVAADDGSMFGTGLATCKATLGLAAALRYNTYTVSYGGSADYAGSTATGKLQSLS